MKRSGSQSSSSSHSAAWTERNEFPSYEDLFYRPPVPQTRGHSQTIMSRLAVEDEGDGPIRALLDEMSDWCMERPEESDPRLYKPLPPPPVEESDDEDAIRKPFGAARALRKVLESTEQLLPTPSTRSLQVKTSVPSTPSTVSLGPKTPTALLDSYRQFADVPQTPISDISFDSSISPAQRCVRARSSSLPLCPPPSLKLARSEIHIRRPPLLKSYAKSLDTLQENVLLHPGFNTSFSAPNTPTAANFMQTKADKRSSRFRMHQSTYNDAIGHFVSGDSHYQTANFSRWSLSTTAQDDNPPPSPLLSIMPNTSKRGLSRSPSRISLALSFAKFDFTKLVRFPSRSRNKKRLIVRGVALGEKIRVQNVKIWSEVYGSVDRVSQKPNGEIHVHFHNRVMAERICRAHTIVTIPGVGPVALSSGDGSKQK